jgi:hypothetical protein
MIIRFGGRHVTRMRMRSSFNYALVLGTRHRDCRTPYRTDDPEPTPLGHYEFYTFSTGTVVRDDTSGSLPAFELNYGLIPNGQLTIDSSALPNPCSSALSTGSSKRMRGPAADRTCALALPKGVTKDTRRRE